MSKPSELQTNPADFSEVDVYAVAGNPIAHSKSPTIHRRFAQQTAQAMHYGTLMPELGEFAKVAKAFFAAGGKGMNVTCLLYTSPSPRDRQKSRMPSSA